MIRSTSFFCVKQTLYFTQITHNQQHTKKPLPITDKTSRQQLRSRLVWFHWLAICRLLIVKIGINAGHKRRTLANREIESPD